MKYEKIAIILRTQRDKSLEEIQQILREEEQRLKYKTGQNGDIYGNEEAFKVKDKYKQRKCYTCGKPNHISKNCWFREENKINKPK